MWVNYIFPLKYYSVGRSVTKLNDQDIMLEGGRGKYWI